MLVLADGTAVCPAIRLREAMSPCCTCTVPWAGPASSSAAAPHGSNLSPLKPWGLLWVGLSYVCRLVLRGSWVDFLDATLSCRFNRLPWKRVCPG